MPEPSIALLLYQYGGKPQPYRFLDDPRYLHVSDLYDLCFRQAYFILQERVTSARFIPPKLQMKFEMGKAVEKVIKEWMVNLGLFQEENVVLADEQLGIIARPDARMKNGMLIEIKAKDPAIFRMTRRIPLRKDQFQLETYLWMDQTKRGKILTATWGDEKNPFRDQEVKYNVKIGEIIKRRASELREAQAGGKLPDRVCTGPDDPHSVLCPVKRQCFEMAAGVIRTIGESL